MDMLASIDLIIQHPITLNSFENFLQVYDKGEGLVYLDLLLSCECYFNDPDSALLKNILEKLEENSISVPRFHIEPLENWAKIDLYPLHAYCLDVLELDYFSSFKKSWQFKSLRAYICRQEIFSNRLSQTSFLPTGLSPKRSVVSLISFYED